MIGPRRRRRGQKSRSQAIKGFLASNPASCRWLDIARDPDVGARLDAGGVGAEELPALFFDDTGPMPRNSETRQVFAAGDLRAGAMNRVASAVGDGSMAAWLAHEYMALT